MRSRNLNGIYRVNVSRADVARFAARWPGFGPCRPLTFVFRADTGDLVDAQGNDDGMDGTGVRMLADDALARARATDAATRATGRG